MSKIFKINFDFYKATVFMLLFFLIPTFVLSAGIDDLKQDLENQIKQKQQEINQHQQNIQETQQKSKTLNNEIQILESQIES